VNTPPATQPAEGNWYEIRLHGVLEQRWAAWFDGMNVTANEDGSTTLCGPLVDQAALHGVLQRLRDLGIPLIAMTQLQPAATAAPAHSVDPASTPAGPTPPPPLCTD
jgi:hypothetical protein